MLPCRGGRAGRTLRAVGPAADAGPHLAKAVALLARAIEMGYPNPDVYRTESDLDPLRHRVIPEAAPEGWEFIARQDEKLLDRRDAVIRSLFLGVSSDSAGSQVEEGRVLYGIQPLRHLREGAVGTTPRAGWKDSGSGHGGQLR